MFCCDRRFSAAAGLLVSKVESKDSIKETKKKKSVEKSFNEGQEIMFFQSKNTQGTTAPNVELQKILSQLLMSTDIITIQ